MIADVPSAYLVIIAHPWGAYSHEVWDFARFAFNFDTLAPAPNSYGDVEQGKGGRTIALTLGGYSESWRWLVKQPFLDHAKILFRSPEEVVWKFGPDTKHTLISLDNADLDGAPIVVSCLRTCRARLTIVPNVVGRPDPNPPRDGYGPVGIGFEVSFDEKLLPQWTEIRAKALCFAAASIVGFKDKKAGFGGGPTCSAVRKAIGSTLR